MRILIDADGCPVVGLAAAVAREYALECLIVCDTAHSLEEPGALTLTVPKGGGQRGLRSGEPAAAGDVVVTQDYGLAAMCLARRARALSQNGMEYTGDNIDALLLQRHTAGKLRKGGGRLKGPPKRTADQDRAFEQALRRMVERGPAAGR